MPPRLKHPWRRALEQGLIRALTLPMVGLIRRLSLRSGRRLAHHLGSVIVLFIPRRVRLASRNLEAAFGDRFSPRERRAIAVNVARNMIKVFVELFRFPDLTPEEVREIIPLEGGENIHAALARGKGAILITAHFGNWELGGARVAAEGWPMAVIARDAADASVASVINRARESQGIRVFGRRDLRGIVRHLHDNGCLGILPDQHANSESARMTFLGRPAWVRRGPAVLALRTGAALIPAFCPRGADDGVTMHVLPEIEVDTSPDREQAITATMAKISSAIEEQIRKRPDQWLWFHDRWKESK